jgi:hypothetical protein
VILVDTSVWVDHLRRGNTALVSLLEAGDVATHPFVIGELACGQIRARRQLLAMLAGLPEVKTLAHDEVVHYLHAHRLEERGLGWIDVHLLAAAALAGVRLWTLDRRLAAAQASRPGEKP